MKRILTLAGFALLLIAARLFVATTAPDVFERGEEFVRGAAAQAIPGGLLAGLNLELESLGERAVGPEALFYHPYEGGGFVHALLTVPAFALFGPSLLAHKVVALAVELGVLFAGLWLAREVFGRRAELPFALLFVFGPLAFQKLALLNLGIHYQALGFQFALAALALGALRGAPRPLTMGLVAGFGLFYNYQLAPLIALVGLALLVRKSFGPRDWGRLIGGFLIGALPLFWMLSRTGAAMFDIHGQTLGETSAGTPGLFDVARNLVAALGPRGFAQLLGLGALAVYAGRTTPGPARLVIGYLVVFLVLLPFSGFLSAGFHDYFGAMRYAPLYGFAVLLAAGAAARPGARTSQLAVAALVLLGISSTAAAARTGEGPGAGFARLEHQRGTDFADYFTKLRSRWPASLQADRSASLRALTHIEGPGRAELLAAATQAITSHDKARLAVIIPDLQAAAPADWQLGLYGLGAWAMRGVRGDMASGQRKLRQQLLKLPDSLLPRSERKAAIAAALEGLGRFGSGAFPTEEALRQELNQMRDRGLDEAVYFGFGWRLHRAFGLAPKRLDELLAGRKPLVVERVRAGFDAAGAALFVD